jgi:hypothetical protein
MQCETFHALNSKLISGATAESSFALMLVWGSRDKCEDYEELWRRNILVPETFERALNGVGIKVMQALSLNPYLDFKQFLRNQLPAGRVSKMYRSSARLQR